jgi:hypothetical protein
LIISKNNLLLKVDPTLYQDLKIDLWEDNQLLDIYMLAKFLKANLNIHPIIEIHSILIIKIINIKTKVKILKMMLILK